MGKTLIYSRSNLRAWVGFRFWVRKHSVLVNVLSHQMMTTDDVGAGCDPCMHLVWHTLQWPLREEIAVQCGEQQQDLKYATVCRNEHFVVLVIYLMPKISPWIRSSGVVQTQVTDCSSKPAIAGGKVSVWREEAGDVGRRWHMLVSTAQPLRFCVCTVHILTSAHKGFSSG